jgi:CRP/FNR family transcriptional regulator
LIAYEDARTRRASGALRKVPAGRALFRAGTAASMLFAIRQGTVKLTRVTPEGDERIESFHLPGEVLGLEAFDADVYAWDAVALDAVQCCELPVPLLHSFTPQTAAMASELVRLFSKGVARTHLARGSARQRVINFLLDLSQRLSARGLDGSNIELSMSRSEMANLLDSRIETVSRILQQLHREQLIRVRGSKVQIGTLAVGQHC